MSIQEWTSMPLTCQELPQPFGYFRPASNNQYHHQEPSMHNSDIAIFVKGSLKDSLLVYYKLQRSSSCRVLCINCSGALAAVFYEAQSDHFAVNFAGAPSPVGTLKRAIQSGIVRQNKH
jgi:hypothetical protein